jgi:O-acetyl-ADP-ribose deacetylase (regulator of RNase III)
MPVVYIAGDLFANKHKVQALAHGCNCLGSMGKGVATGFRDRYPEMYKKFRQRCKADPREFNPGDCFFWKEADRPSVFNLATQRGYKGATFEAIESSLSKMRRQAEQESIQSIAMPRIGAGYGGLDWDKVKEVIGKVFSDWKGTLYVYEEFKPEQE